VIALDQASVMECHGMSWGVTVPMRSFSEAESEALAFDPQTFSGPLARLYHVPFGIDWMVARTICLITIELSGFGCLCR
jgi:hypothetical protein